MSNKMVQVAMMKVRKLQRLASANPKGENDHIPLAPFFQSHLSRRCELGSTSDCQVSIADDGRRETEKALAGKLGRPTQLAEAVIFPESGVLPSPAADVVGVDAAAVVVDGAHGAEGGYVLVPEDAAVEAAATHCWSEKPLWSPISTSELCDEHVAAVDALVADRPPSARVRNENKANITLTVVDFRLLVGERWLNDELKLLCGASQSSSQATELVVGGQPSRACVAAEDVHVQHVLFRSLVGARRLLRRQRRAHVGLEERSRHWRCRPGDHPRQRRQPALGAGGH